jgi:hypothetical protein
VTLDVTDTSDTPNTASFDLSILFSNNEPTFNETISSTYTVAAFTTLSFQRSLSDVDGGDIVYGELTSATSIPAGITHSYDARSFVFSFSWTPTNADVGRHALSFEYWDTLRASNKLSKDFTVTVTPNLPPAFNSAPADQQVTE